jgi:hypothetical protein
MEHHPHLRHPHPCLPCRCPDRRARRHHVLSPVRLPQSSSSARSSKRLQPLSVSRRLSPSFEPSHRAGCKLLVYTELGEGRSCCHWRYHHGTASDIAAFAAFAALDLPPRALRFRPTIIKFAPPVLAILSDACGILNQRSLAITPPLQAPGRRSPGRCRAPWR